ncbi:MAG: polyphosphate kinase 1 [Candidatus Kapabacteria bacterium]|nr:polyphosphate kinase 1 [Candidatus Kapabacteria bacterium]
MDDQFTYSGYGDLDNPELYFNRELSFIEFNKRVLSEAENLSHPLLERLKFTIIVSTNLDEFFMIRVSGLKNQVAADIVEISYDGKTPEEQLEKIRKELVPLYEKQEIILNDTILPALAAEGVEILNIEDLTDKEKIFLEEYFLSSVFPLLTPRTLDPGHPFPKLKNRNLNIVFALKNNEKNSEKKIAFVELSTKTPRFVRINRKNGNHFVLMEQMIKQFASYLFPGLKIKAANTFRVTRDADIDIVDDEADDLMNEISEQIKRRRWGKAAVRLEVSTRMPKNILKILKKSLELEDSDIYFINRSMNLGDFFFLYKLDLKHLKDQPFLTRTLPQLKGEDVNIFNVIKKSDLMVQHPYDSFTNSTLKFMNQSADDPDVLAIKITLYRTGMNSDIVETLKRAALNGKDVMAFVELKARFDEENNIIWAKELENVGVNVIYGVIGLKTHCKIAMVVRREGKKLRTYLHLGTGNYNQITARIYTDIGLFTAREEFVMDSIHLFNYLTGYSYYEEWKSFNVGPINLRQRLIDLIRRETELHTPENPGFIFAKMNSIAHRMVIPELYRASQKGVKIKLLVRGICCLRPGLPGISENIEVRSIIGRFLEHSRICYFHNAGNEEYYLSSADWMSRNLHKRVELMFPIHDEQFKLRLKEILDTYWNDNSKAWDLNSDGSYLKRTIMEEEEMFNAQEFFLNEFKSSFLKKKE